MRLWRRLGAAVVAVASLGAAADDVLYRIGGAEPISLGATRRSNTLDFSVNARWRANLTCGDFDIATSVGNQLNSAVSGFQRVMGGVINAAQGVVASLPALVIQRLNPGLYDLLQNGVLEAGQAFRIAKLRCEELTGSMGETLVQEGWSGIARADYWRSQIGLGIDDPMAVNDDLGLDAGVEWIGGDKRGGAGDPPIDIGGDVGRAGLNAMAGRSATDTTAITDAQCGGGPICEMWADPADLEAWLDRVVGSIEIQTCDGCEKVRTRAGMGLGTEVNRVRDGYWTTLQTLMTPPYAVPSQAQMDALSGGVGYRVSRGLVDAMRAEREPLVVARRVAAELAVGQVLDQAALARRALLAGMREPQVSGNELALRATQGLLAELDGDIRQLEFELRVKGMLAGGTPSVILNRNLARRAVPVVEREPGGGMREGAPR